MRFQNWEIQRAIEQESDRERKRERERGRERASREEKGGLVFVLVNRIANSTKGCPASFYRSICSEKHFHTCVSLEKNRRGEKLYERLLVVQPLADVRK